MLFRILKIGYQKFASLFTKTGSVLGKKVRTIVKGKLSQNALEGLEKLFYEADLGVATVDLLMERCRELMESDPDASVEKLIGTIEAELIEQLEKYSQEVSLVSAGEPTVILVVGVNGSGKTTSVAKLANHFKKEGKKVLLCAADTFRAAAIEQLALWAERLGVELVKGQPRSDPAAVVFDGITAAKARACDVVLVDTAGRLHTKEDLMHELNKVRRVSAKAQEGAPHETLLVVDASTGQNAIEQAKTFHKFTPITGLVLTKLDGSAKGGVVIAIQNELKIPVKFVGVGEGLDDLEPFDPSAFVKSLF
ncbi:signal recognition particle-docking protein FtsY [Simkania negevensis]|uniref:Signal recognition particle receptor FtsY n=1 Tax=Simkania negevensis TaxID=83561 RepID=A0ABS3AT78_9BACT|nr:signal recognition particle-docking protein FtsY [Simkania negevensis]